MTRRTHILTVLVGVLVLAATWVAAMAGDISAIEERLFRTVNDLPDWIEYPGWPVMQLGSLAAVPILAVGWLVISREWRLPARLMLAGGTVWVATKVIKTIVDRGRPGEFLADINLRPAWNGLGFPSGHTAVAFAIAVILGAALGRRWRIAIWSVAVVAGLLRIYTAAHFPLDVLGGWGFGAAVGALVELGWSGFSRHSASGPTQTAETG